MINEDLKLYAAGKGVRLWQIAKKFNVTDSYFSRKLRQTFSAEDSERFKAFVDDIAATKDGEKRV